MAKGARVLAAVFLAGSLLIGAPSLGATASELRVSPQVVLAGGQVKVSGTGFVADEPLDVYLGRGQIAVVGTSGAGSATLMVHVPATAPPGARWVTAVGRRSGRVAQALVYVVGSGAWPMERVDAGRTAAAGGTSLEALDVRRLERIWVRRATGPCDITHRPLPLLSSRSILVGGCELGNLEEYPIRTYLWARSLPTGRLLWTHEFAGQGGMALDDGAVYVGLSDYQTGRIAAVDLVDGSVLWTSQPRASEAFPFTPVPWQGFVFASSTDRLLALVAGDGSFRWSAPLQMGTTSIGAWGPPAIADGIAVVAGDGRLAAFGVMSGEVRWMTPELNDLPAGSANSVAPSIRDGVVYASVFGGSDEGSRSHLLAVDLTDGSILWERQEPGAWYQEGATVTADLVVLPSTTWRRMPARDMEIATGWQLRAFDRLDGGDAWAASGEQLAVPGFETLAPVAADDVLWLNTDAALLGVSLEDGSPVGELPWSDGTPIVVGGVVYAQYAGALRAYGLGPPPPPQPDALVPDIALEPTSSPSPTGSLPGVAPPAGPGAPRTPGARSAAPWVAAAVAGFVSVVLVAVAARLRGPRRAAPAR